MQRDTNADRRTTLPPTIDLPDSGSEADLLNILISIDLRSKRIDVRIEKTKNGGGM
jgi:hypothetical protein